MKQPLHVSSKTEDSDFVNWTLRNVKDNPTLKNAKSVNCRKYFKKHRYLFGRNNYPFLTYILI